jgi:dihydroxyacetone kinase
MDVKWIDHKGKNILYIDYRGVIEQSDSIKLLRKAIEIEKNSNGNLLILQNFEGTFANNEYMTEVKKLGKEVKDKVLKNAIVGISGIKKILFSAYVSISGERNIKTFESEEEGKEWLVT